MDVDRSHVKKKLQYDDVSRETFFFSIIHK